MYLFENKVLIKKYKSMNNIHNINKYQNWQFFSIKRKSLSPSPASNQKGYQQGL